MDIKWNNPLLQSQERFFLVNNFPNPSLLLLAILIEEYKYLGKKLVFIDFRGTSFVYTYFLLFNVEARTLCS